MEILNFINMYSTLQKIIDQLNFNTINAERKSQIQILANYIQKKMDENGELALNFICTHNSRRSQFSQIWSYTAAFYYNLPIISYSGGVEVTAFNERAVKTIIEMGFEVNKNGDENPIYTVKCAEEAPELQMFSKLFDDQSVTFHPFGAVMTCDHADENCPFIPIADARIPLRYEDPKKFDDTELEGKMYHERSLQIATELFYCYSLIKK
jgi:arsenate reductase